MSGELEHKDSLGNLEILKRGDVQFTNAGTGIRHSEYNRNADQDNHFLQIWAKPAVKGLKPSYVTRAFSEASKTDALVKIMQDVSRRASGAKDTGEGAIPIHSDLDMYASILNPGKSVSYETLEGDRRVYVHVVMNGKEQPKTGGSRIKIGDVEIGEGDGALVENPAKDISIESVGDKAAEFILFDLGRTDDE